MTLNGRNVTLAEIKYFYEARRKNVNEDIFMLSAAKCRPMIIAARNTKYMRIFATRHIYRLLDPNFIHANVHYLARIWF